MAFILDKNCEDLSLVGGKAGALARLSRVRADIPEWFALSAGAYLAYNSGNQDDIRAELDAALSAFGDDTLFAVRSSAVGEDGAEHSFAGQFESYLNVKKADVFEKTLAVWASADSERVRAYKAENGIEGDCVPAVLIQRMVLADCAGVAFGANPVNGASDESVVSAVEGLGDKLVDGTADADNYTVRRGEITRSSDGERVLADEQVLEISRLAKLTSRFFGRYQDIEWAYEGGKLFLLQSRPITSLRRVTSTNDMLNIWDNSNIAESYNGVTTPLTFSLIRLAYEHVYREMCRMLGVSEKRLAENDYIFSHMLGLHDGQVYYNLLSWYKLLALLPGYKSNSGFMEQMMGVKEPLPDEAKKQLPITESGKLSDFFGLIGAVFGLLRRFWGSERGVRRFFELLQSTLKGRDLTELTLYELSQYYREIERKLLKSWDAPVINDFFAMIFYGLLRKASVKWCKVTDEHKFNGLLRHTGGIKSAEPARLVRELAELAKEGDLVNSMLKGSAFDIEGKLNGEIKQGFADYISEFGDRCLNELKLESATLADDPTSLYRAVGGMAARLTSGAAGIPEPVFDESEFKRKLFFRRPMFNYILKHARRTVRNRENLRFERTRVFGEMRRIAREIGMRLASFGVLDERDDIYYLELLEIFNYIEGCGASADLKGLANVRKREFAAYVPPRDDRFETYGCVPLSKRHVKSAAAVYDPNAEALSGLGCCPGIVRGRARVITDPAGATINAGEILVAQRTDPGWIMLFPASAGVLVEYGSLLSHAAIVVREMGIPAVVSVKGLFAAINDGDIVELDGEKGTVVIIERKGGEKAEE